MNKKEIEEFATMKSDIGYIKKGLDQNNEQHEEIMDKLDSFFEQADSRYANKRVEMLVYGLVGTILTAVTVAGLNLLF